MSITASEARKELFPLIKKVNDNHETVEISSKHGNVVVMSADDFASWQETIYLLRSPENARRLTAAIAEDRQDADGGDLIRKTTDELHALADEPHEGGAA